MPLPFIETLGQQTLGNAVGAGMGLLLQGANNRQQIKQQQKLTDMQLAAQKQMGIFNREQQMQLWNDTNYSAQKEQMKKAGLSPGLMYGQSGGGGMTASATPGNVSAPQAGKNQESLGMGLQMGQAAMMAAQIDLLKAQTEKTKAETPNLPLTGENIKADTALKGAQKEIIDTEQGIVAVQRAVAEATQNAQIATILQGTEASMKELEILRNNKEISDATKYTQMKQATANLANTILDNGLKEAQTKLSGAQKDKAIQEIKNLQQQWNINSMDEEMAKVGMNPNAGTVYKMIHSLLRGIKQMFGF